MCRITALAGFQARDNATVTLFIYEKAVFVRDSTLKILLLSFHFPPDAPLAATRAPKLARFLKDQGHDIRVLCARNPQPQVTHDLEFDESRVLRTEWRDLRAIPGALIERVGRSLKPSKPSPIADVFSTSQPRRSTLRNRLASLYDAVICRPDRYQGWSSFAIDAARKLFQDWQPDIIYATCPPHSTALLADRLARMADVPFVTEFRDRWAHDAYSDHPEWRKSLDAMQEQRTLARAAGIVTVSPIWAEEYARRFGAAKVSLAMNGFDPAEYPADIDVPQGGDPDGIELLYAGVLYPGRRDPTPLFEAIAMLGEDASRVRVTMLGNDLEAARPIAERCGISHVLTLLPPEPHASIVQRQHAADALILLQWNDARDAGTVPGKVFEYAAARRPVLATGWEEGVVARLIRDRGLGTICNDAHVLSETLRGLLAEKRAHGHIRSLPLAVREGLSRDEQFEKLERFLHTVLAPHDERVLQVAE